MRLRRLTAVAAAVVLGLTTVSGLPAEAKPKHKPKPDPYVQVQILSFNDFHGNLQPPSGSSSTLGTTLDPSATPVGGVEYLSSTLSTLRKQARYSQTVAAGDLIGGSPFVSGVFHDEPAVESLNALGLNVSSVGNHEFDEGVTELKRMQKGGCRTDDGCYAPWGPQGYPGADFRWLAANVVKEKTGKTVLPGTAIRKVGGVKIGYIGMTLEGTPSLVAAEGIKGVQFKDEVKTANKAARQLRRQGVKAIVVLLHEGGLQTGTYKQCVAMSGPVVDISENLDPEIDLVVTGHTHQPYICNIPDPAGKPRMVTSASAFGRVVTETTLNIHRKTGQVARYRMLATNHLVPRTQADPIQTEIVKRWEAAAAPVGNRVIGSITADINRSAGRNTEGPLANVIADAQLAATAAPENGGAQIAFMNPGGVRADLTYNQSSGGEAPGQVTYGEAYVVQPFGNLLVTMKLTGAQIEALLEQQYIPGRAGGEQLIFGVSKGFTFTYDPSAAVGSRVPASSIKLNGVTLDPTASYSIVTNSFLSDGGDSFSTFTLGTDKVNRGDDLTAFAAYLSAAPVSPPEDRINGI